MKKGKVLVNGGCGFIGREVVKQLLEKGYLVTVLDDFSNSTPLKNTSKLKVINFDLTKSGGILDFFKGTDYCIHLAARVGGIKYMSSNKSEILRDNILMDLNVISSACKTNTKIVYTSTVIVYDQSKKIPYKEQDLLYIPKSDYGFSKLVGERLCQSWGRYKNLKFTIARISNVYGVNSNEISKDKLHVIPDLVRKITQNKNLKLIEGGRQRRVFIHVSDVADALILMMESKASEGDVFNLATEEEYQILEIAKIIWQRIRMNERFTFENVKFEEEDFINSIPDASKLKEKLGWKPKKNLKDSLPEIIKWYQNIYDKKTY